MNGTKPRIINLIQFVLMMYVMSFLRSVASVVYGIFLKHYKYLEISYMKIGIKMTNLGSEIYLENTTYMQFVTFIRASLKDSFG